MGFLAERTATGMTEKHAGPRNGRELWETPSGTPAGLPQKLPMEVAVPPAAAAARIMVLNQGQFCPPGTLANVSRQTILLVPAEEVGDATDI